MHALIINEAPLQVLPSLAKAIGLNEALILQQIHYWLNPKHNQNFIEDRYWVYNTYEQWQAQFPFWCTRTIRTAIDKLEEAGLLKTFITHKNGPVKHYSINYNALDQIQTAVAVKATEISHHSPDLTLHEEKKEEEKEEEEKREEDLHEMISVWNEALQREHSQPLLQPAYLTTRRAINLETLQKFLTSRGTSWRQYCNKITNTRFLMGDNLSGFKVSLDWALNIDNAVKILEGAIYDKPIQQASTQQISHQSLENDSRDLLNWARLTEEIKAHLPSSVYTQEWLETCQHLVKSLGEVLFKAWFLKTGLISITVDASGKDIATLQVDSYFKRNYLYNHFRDQIEAALRSVRPSITHIKFHVISPHDTQVTSKTH